MHRGTLKRERVLTTIASLALLSAALFPARSFALQPLAVFLEESVNHHPDALEAHANVAQQDAQADVALGRQLPGISARGSYVRNQYESTLELPVPGGPAQRMVLQPRDRLTGLFTVTVPLVDLAGFRRISAARTGAKAASHQLDATRLAVQGQVAQSYYQLVANLALLTASEKALEFSQQNLKITEDRFEAGSAAVLDVERARADVEQQAQQVAAAGLQIELAARALQSASGVTPHIAGAVLLDDDLHDEPPLETFERDFERLPAVTAAALTARAAEQQAEAQELALVPSLVGNLSEAYTHSSGAGGREWGYQAALTVVWSFDLTSTASIRAQRAAAHGARARELRAQLRASDDIHREWNTVRSNVARSRSARAQQAAATHAADLARHRYRAGAATQLDLLQAQRDAFSADVARIQADAELVNARAQLRLAAGTSLTSYAKEMP